MGSPISGKNGKVLVGATEIGDVTQWSLNDKVPGDAYGSNNTSGGTKRVAMRADFDGSVEYKLDNSAVAPLAPGDQITLNLYLSATEIYVCPSHISEIGTVVDINTGKIIGHTAKFEANGAITRPVLGS